MISVPVIGCYIQYKDITPLIDTFVLVVPEPRRKSSSRSVQLLDCPRSDMDEINAMSLEESRRSQRPYRYGMVLLCVGALINWLGLAENYVEPIDDPIHVISIEEPSTGYRQKPPDYEAVTDAPPSYDDAIKLNPSHLVRLSNSSALSMPAVHNMVPRTVEIVSRDPTPSPPPPYAR
ncbi:uncharacterized protein LOC143259002 isoform X3 [Megalopta genalis]|uniref:uncharacterized protein LOC143259002 isoform X3 n=1 Tax=Megalopta genalis TaxID=115081 RepID=UPI003FD18341